MITTASSANKLTSVTRPISDPVTIHVLQLLRASDTTMSELHEHGIQAPAQAIYELQLAGYTIDRVHTSGTTTGYRLRSSSPEAEDWLDAYTRADA